MFYVLFTAWVWWNEWLPTNQISRNNESRRSAEVAYRAGQYGRALELYTYLSRTTGTPDPAVRLNLGHTYFQLRRYSRAKPQYASLLQSDRPDLRTVAATQLGVIACFERDSATALTLFRQALLESTDNEPARYNFELIKRYYSGKAPTTNHRQKPSEPTAQRLEKPRPAGQQVERSERQDELLERFKRLHLTEEQALQLLDAMQHDDLPYALTRSARRADRPAGEGNRW